MITIAAIFNAIALGFWVCVGMHRKRIFGELKIHVININQKFYTVSDKEFVKLTIENETVYYYKGKFYTEEEIKKLNN